MFRLLLALLLGALAVTPAFAQDPTRDAFLLYRTLKCPVCETSLEGSDSALANQMKEQIRQKLAAGETPEQITAYFVERYGESILVAPPKEGPSLTAWIMPAVGFVIGIGVVTLALRRLSRRAPSAPLVPADDAPLDPEYAARLERELQEAER
ncbi:MAG: cytochrome c-type biogenesis protein [Chloroflexota bacterium]|nr:cytochrome c-type biogenesis protein CcmH [Dehalococcoidia bacterium]MDW8254734.1 cytochrome c-type biogenesis protein [Chloroflexota bacterium]